MIKLPNLQNAFAHENNFYLTCTNQRIYKFVSHYELFKRTLDIPGAIVECGVFKGTSLIRFATFRDLLSLPTSKKIIGFDTFTEYPQANLPEDKLHRETFTQSAGESCISVKQLREVLDYKGIKNVELVEGNILETVPQYVDKNPWLRVSLLHLDCTIYEPTLVSLQNFYDKLSVGGLLLLNGYGKEGVVGETNAVDFFFRNNSVTIRKLPFAYSPCYIAKRGRMKGECCER